MPTLTAQYPGVPNAATDAQLASCAVGGDCITLAASRQPASVRRVYAFATTTERDAAQSAMLAAGIPGLQTAVSAASPVY